MKDAFEYTDKALKYLRRYFIMEYNRTKDQIRADALNVVSPTMKLYDRMRRETIRVFLLIAKRKYGEYADGNTITEMWLLGLLNTANPLTGYIFLNDVERKRQYFAESIMSGMADTGGKIPPAVLERECKKALRYWYQSVRQYADIVTDEAAMQAFINTGADAVEYITARDEGVCSICSPRDGIVYPIDRAPRLPAHYNCRCFYRAVRQ